MRRRRTQPIMYMPRDAKVNEAQPKTAEEIFAERIVELKADLAAQKEKYRWRNVDEEEPPRETEVLICCVSRSGAHKYVYTASFDGEDFYDRRGDSPSGEIKYWWPLDLPEMGETK